MRFCMNAALAKKKSSQTGNFVPTVGLGLPSPALAAVRPCRPQGRILAQPVGWKFPDQQYSVGGINVIMERLVITHYQSLHYNIYPTPVPLHIGLFYHQCKKDHSPHGE